MFSEEIPQLGVQVVASCPGEAKKYSSHGWSLQTLQTIKDIWRSNIFKGVREVLRKMQVKRAFAPHVVPASANVVNINVLHEQIDLGKNIVLCRNNSVPADGVFLGKGHAFVMSSAGCPIIVAKAGRQMVVAHASRDSLIDRGAVMDNPSRRNVSVVQSIVKEFLDRGASLNEISMCMLLSIPADRFEHRFDHPKFGDYNTALAIFIDEKWPRSGTIHDNEGVFPNLEGIFLEQAKQVHVCSVWTEHPLAKHSELAHTRDGHPDSACRRNLIVVKRLDS